MKNGKRPVNMLILIIDADGMIVVMNDIEEMTISAGMNLPQELSNMKKKRWIILLIIVLVIL